MPAQTLYKCVASGGRDSSRERVSSAIPQRDRQGVHVSPRRPPSRLSHRLHRTRMPLRPMPAGHDRLRAGVSAAAEDA